MAGGPPAAELALKPVLPRPGDVPRVAYVTNSRGLGGAEELIASLVEEGEARDWRQLLLVPFSTPESKALAERCPGATYQDMPCDRVWQLPRLRHWLGRRLEAFDPDLVHVTLFQSTVLMATVRRGRERRLVTHAYGGGLRRLSHPRTRLKLDRWAAGRVDHVSAISNAVHSFLTGEHGFPPPPVGRIRLGWRGQPLPRPQRGEDMPPTVVCVAALRSEKGHDVLLRAFSAVREELPAARLVLVGAGPARGALEEQARASGLSDSVHFAGLVPEIWEYLRDADVFALASYAEALGIGIMEAMAAGLPVVASDVGGIPELVEPGVTGELFPPGDHGALSRHLITLLASPERRREMAAAGRGAAEGMHMRESVREYFDLYGRLVSEARAGMAVHG